MPFLRLNDMNYSFISMLIIAGSLGGTAQERTVDGNTITSSATPAVRLVLDSALEYEARWEAFQDGLRARALAGIEVAPEPPAGARYSQSPAATKAPQ